MADADTEDLASITVDFDLSGSDPALRARAVSSMLNGYMPNEKQFDIVLGDDELNFHALKIIEKGYLISFDQLKVIIAKGGWFSIRAVDMSLQNGLKLKIKELDELVKLSSKGTSAENLAYQHAIGSIISNNFPVTPAQIDRWIKLNNARADAAVLEAVKAGMKLTEVQRDRLLTHDTSEATRAVVESITPDDLPSSDQIDRWLAPAYVGGRNGKQYGNILYTKPEDRGRLADYDTAVAAAQKAGYVFTPDQLKFVEIRTKVPEFFPANAPTPGLGRVSDTLTRALGIARS